MTELYPAIKPFDSCMLPVGQGHTLYLEQSGNPKGIPVLYLHGGPGAGIGEEYRRFFDPQLYRIIGFDQRGCGKSEPFGELNENTSQRLLEDVFAIQGELQIDNWLLFGGSWGSTLALLIAIARPESVSGLILRGIFLARQQDYDWFLEQSGAAAQLFPEYYQEFIQPVEDKLKSQSLVETYYTIFKQGDELTKMAAIKAWYLWEVRISKLHSKYKEEALLPNVHNAISLALLECHYIKYRCFIAENFILDNIQKITHIPTTIIHGRYDCVCKMEAAFSLNKYLKNSQLTIVPESGHSAFEPQIAQALILATKSMATFLTESK